MERVLGQAGLLAGPSLLRSGFDPRPLYVRFVVENVTLGQFFASTSVSVCQLSFYRWSYLFLTHNRHCKIFVLDKVLK
jgi:hypothetical protein